MSTTPCGLKIIHIKRRDAGSVTVDCPYCGGEHSHATGGVHTALCGLGTYSAISAAGVPPFITNHKEA